LPQILAMKSSSNVPLGIVFHKQAKQYFGALAKFLEDIGIDKYFYVITLVIENEKLTQQDLANFFKIDKASVVRIVDYLSDKNLVYREKCQSDRRCYYLKASDLAKELHPKILNYYKLINDKAFEGIETSKIAIFNEVINQLSANLESLPSTNFFVKYINTEKKK